MFYVNLIKSCRDVVAICDAEIFGKKFEEGRFQLDIKENFYNSKQGEQVDKDKAREIMQKMLAEDATFNIVGEKSIALAIKEGIIFEESVKKIAGIPYSLVLI